MATVVFSNLLADATLTVTGQTYMTMAGTNIFITNTRMGWNNYRLAAPSNGLLYVDTAHTGSGKNGIIYLGGNWTAPDGRGGR